ncbi:GAF domain-containing sensor histidine kinase [Mastigocoleus sp. MO_188.B34]|uniref:GAF domain-containing sensor histidine kinase n=1 Tax=Mastigocoleus sp. MO_188.B34 TaxID=3036635 RepID=UPI002626E594|nr:GAF domain-containing sensor histidine kinase [Mastigocoleus sp. MO_188.B34]MDJ0694115.1 ATP-binding protein [Mastigocoleus sp. MO_188.B34]
MFFNSLFLQLGERQRKQQALAMLSSLSYRDGKLPEYLKEIACGVSKLIGIDLSVVTICHRGSGKILASSIDMGKEHNSYSLHGQLSGTVVKNKQNLIVEDTQVCSEYGVGPDGYRAYLGIPLKTSKGEVIGTVCSFHKRPRNFSDEELEITQLFAERAATAIDNYQLYQQQRQFNEALEAEVARRTEQLRQAQAKLVEKERLAAIGEFASGIIHEIRNPFTTMKMGLNFFKKLDLSEPAQVRLCLALEEADRLERLLKEILLYAKPQNLELIPIDINQLITNLLVALQIMPEAEGRKLEFLPANSVVKIMGDEDKIKQVLINLVRNAYEAINVGDTVKLQIEYQTQDQQVYIRIHNGGEAIPAEVLPKLTQPFFSTKSSGTGLGLAIVKRIIEAHNGELSIISAAELGTIISIKLPTSS